MKGITIRNRNVREITGSLLLAAVMIGAGIILCFIVPVLIKQFVLKPVRMDFFQDSPAGRLFQWTGNLILIIAGYILHAFIFRKKFKTDLRVKHIPMDLLKGLLWGCGSILIILLILRLFGIYSVDAVAVSSGGRNMILLLFLLAFTEEVLYRGILFSLTKSLWCVSAAHFGWNLAQVLSGLTLSGLNEFSHLAVLDSRLTGPEILTGGSFGVENSLVTILYTGIITAVLSLLVARKKRLSRTGCEL